MLSVFLRCVKIARVQQSSVQVCAAQLAHRGTAVCSPQVKLLLFLLLVVVVMAFCFILRIENTELLTGDERSLALRVKGI